MLKELHINYQLRKIVKMKSISAGFIIDNTYPGYEMVPLRNILNVA